MRLAVAMFTMLLAGCFEEVDARWQLDHDHVLAARATPPRVMPGEMAVLDGLVAHDGALVSIEAPSFAAAPGAPAELQAMLRRDGDRWTITAPDDASLASTRPAMGLPDDAPVPMDVVMTFERPGADPFYVKKTVWLGARGAHPMVPALAFDGSPAAETLVMPRDRDVYVAIEAPTGMRVNWFTSCGTLFQDDVATAFLQLAAEEPCEGELAVVLRAPDGGVAWQLWPVRGE